MRKLLSANFSRLFHSKIYWLGMAFMFGLAAFAVGVRYGDYTVDPVNAYATAYALPEHIERLPIYSLILTAITTAGGAVLFRRKDLK